MTHLACVVTLTDPSNDETSTEVYLNYRKGLYRALEWMGDPVEDSLNDLSIEALEEYADRIAATANTDGAVTWTSATVFTNA